MRLTLWIERDAGWRPRAVSQWRPTVAPADAAGCRVCENAGIGLRDAVLRIKMESGPLPSPEVPAR